MNAPNFIKTFPDAKPYTTSLQRAMASNQINTPLREAHFLAQVAHESNRFKSIEENLNYSASGLLKTFGKYFNAESAKLYARKPEKIANRVYANRMGNSDEQSGDGWRYRGRGFIQLTGKANYRAFAVSLNDMLLDDLVVYILSPDGASMSAAWFWNENSLNFLADKNDITSITKKINGGFYGLAERKELFENMLELI